MDIGIDIVLLHEVAQDVRVRSGNLPAIKPLQSWIINLLRDGKAQTALAETQSVDDLGILATLHELVLTYDTDVGYTRGYTLWDIVIAKVKHFERKITCLHQEGAL